MNSGPKFRAEQMVEVIGVGDPIYVRLIGRRFVLEGAPHFFPADVVRVGPTWAWLTTWGAEFDVINLCLEECFLKPIYDGNQVVRWEDCAWRPRELETVLYHKSN